MTVQVDDIVGNERRQFRQRQLDGADERQIILIQAELGRTPVGPPKGQPGASTDCHRPAASRPGTAGRPQ
jgi:hypothetical protein